MRQLYLGTPEETPGDAQARHVSYRPGYGKLGWISPTVLCSVLFAGQALRLNSTQELTYSRKRVVYLSIWILISSAKLIIAYCPFSKHLTTGKKRRLSKWTVQSPNFQHINFYVLLFYHNHIPLTLSPLTSITLHTNTDNSTTILPRVSSIPSHTLPYHPINILHNPPTSHNPHHPTKTPRLWFAKAPMPQYAGHHYFRPSFPHPIFPYHQKSSPPFPFLPLSILPTHPHSPQSTQSPPLIHTQIATSPILPRRHSAFVHG